MQIVKLVWGTSSKRIGSTIALLSVVAMIGFPFGNLINAGLLFLGLSPLPDLSPWIGFPILLLGVVLVVFGDCRDRADKLAKVNPHDIALLKQFRSEFHAGLREFLREHTFGDSFPSQLVLPVFHVANWRGPEYELTDREAEKQFAKVKACARKMADLLAYKTWPHRVAQGFHTALPDYYDEWAPAPEVLKAIGELNSGARDLIEATDQFERMARVRFPTD
ncbi:hypothetical protein [Chelatococcus sp. XZ-Ab1]|uniref:hypothetical protein n=1 Tax=Chelatococcus sp. XZ-Ab1 TaxID=3034027 RepID=UPI0023E38B7E|nr:hypothetical protein [Chelatococcus sp. XZ-Ab1]